MKIISAVLLPFLICTLAVPVLIPFLRRMKFGQQILEIGPNWHKKKAGTPTMGGLAFILSTAAGVLIMSLFYGPSSELNLALFFALACGAVGFADDYIKVCLKRNMGLNVLQKTVCLAAAAALFLFFAIKSGIIDTKIVIPFTDMRIDLKLFYYVVAFIAIFATVNSVNLTDGIDGLASSVTSVVMIFFAFALYKYKMDSLAVLPLTVLGGLLGFLIFNKNPAKVFMGDTGSLFLGGTVAALAILMGNPLIILLAGMVYVIESLSVVLQVASFKLTGKRIFKMSPIHHHFEMCGFNENKIDLLFVAAAAVFSVIGYLSL